MLRRLVTNPLLHIEQITRKSVLEHPLLAPRLDEIYEKACLQNPTLPSTLEKFVNGTLDGERGSALFVNGRVKWQKALFDWLHDTRAKGWQRTARKRVLDFEFSATMLASCDAAAIWIGGQLSHWAEHNAILSCSENGRHLLLGTS